MKILAMAAMAAMVAGTASARNIEIDTGTAIPVCVKNEIPGITLSRAEALSSKMFVAAGVTIDWRAWSACPVGGIRVSLSWNTPESENPHSFAYALPYEGTHIVLFWDRIASAAQPETLPWLLAHVLVHEVTHIIQGTCRHSETGVMKATFTGADIANMEFHPLTFTEEDIELIHFGMEIRRDRLAAPN
jgi:hypothetical protein